MIVSYLLNKSIVFQQQDKHRVVKITQFIIITAFGLFVLQNGIIYLLVHHFNFFGNLIASLVQAVGLSGLSQNFINLNTAKILATVVTLTWNYFMYRYVVFVKKPKPTG